MVFPEMFFKGLILIIGGIVLTVNEYEHYDAEVNDITEAHCGTLCTEGVNCQAFGYKPRERKCYLSGNAIWRKPYASVHRDKYNKLDKRCNKINRITDFRRIDGNSLTRNSIYLCSDGEINKSYEYQYTNMNGILLDRVKSTPFDRADSDIVIPQNAKYLVNLINFDS